MTLKEQEEKEEQEQTLWIDQVYRLVSMEWLEYIRRGERDEKKKENRIKTQVHCDVGSFVGCCRCQRRCVMRSFVRVFFHFLCVLHAFRLGYVVSRERRGWRKRLATTQGGVCPVRQSSSAKDKWFRALGRQSANMKYNCI
jgi:hypothetical protein